MRVFSYISSINIWDILGSSIVEAAQEDYFGYSISLLADRIIVTIEASEYDKNGT